MEKIVFGGGCFWCIEAIFSKTKGVISAISGYSGGDTPNPTYQEVCTGLSTHAEVVEVTFDSDALSLKEILAIFFSIHDPTQLDRQGNDVGRQYRSIIFYQDDEQRLICEEVMSALALRFDLPIVTQLEPLDIFYKAEDYHQNYFETNPLQGYCQMVIAPKIEAFKAHFSTFVR